MSEKPEKFVDLHESEWSRTGKKEPILGPNGIYFLIMFPTSFAIYHAVAWLLIDVVGLPTGR